MTRRTVDNIFATVFAVALGMVAALSLSHWAACEEDDTVCLFTGEAS